MCERFNEELVNFKLRLVDGIACTKICRRRCKLRKVVLILPPPYVHLRWDASDKKKIKVRDIARVTAGTEQFNKTTASVIPDHCLSIEGKEIKKCRSLHLMMESIQERDEFVQGMRLLLEDLASTASFDRHGVLKRSVAFGEIEHPLVRLVAESHHFVS